MNSSFLLLTLLLQSRAGPLQSWSDTRWFSMNFLYPRGLQQDENGCLRRSSASGNSTSPATSRIPLSWEVRPCLARDFLLDRWWQTERPNTPLTTWSYYILKHFALRYVTVSVKNWFSDAAGWWTACLWYDPREEPVGRFRQQRDQPGAEPSRWEVSNRDLEGWNSLIGFSFLCWMPIPTS